MYIPMCYSIYMYMYFGITHGLLTYSHTGNVQVFYLKKSIGALVIMYKHCYVHVVMLLLYTCICIHTHSKRYMYTHA